MGMAIFLADVPLSVDPQIDIPLELIDIRALFERVSFQESDEIDVTAFMVWFVENYPKSVQVMKNNPDYQYKFK